MNAPQARVFGLGVVAGMVGVLSQQPALALGGSVVVSQTSGETSVVVTNAAMTSYTTQLPSPATPSPFDYTLKLNPGTTSPNLVTPTWNAGAGDPFYQFSGAGMYNSLVSLGTPKIFNGTLDTTIPDPTNNSRLFVYNSGKIEFQVSSTLNSSPDCYTGVTVTGAVNTSGCAPYLNSLVLTLQTGKTGFVPGSVPGSLPSIASLLANFTGSYLGSGSISTGAGEGINNYSVTAAVPGPLPVLGAGAAFGFSRRLRRRVRLSRANEKATC